MLQYNRMDISEGIDVNKNLDKNFLSMDHIYVMVVMICL